MDLMRWEKEVRGGTWRAERLEAREGERLRKQKVEVMGFQGVAGDGDCRLRRE